MSSCLSPCDRYNSSNGFLLSSSDFFGAASLFRSGNVHLGGRRRRPLRSGNLLTSYPLSFNLKICFNRTPILTCPLIWDSVCFLILGEKVSYLKTPTKFYSLYTLGLKTFA